MGLFESLLGAVISTAMKQSGKDSEIDKIATEAARCETDVLVRKWRNCSDPLKKGIYYREMQSREDVEDYL